MRRNEEKKKGPVPAAQVCGWLTATWPAEEEDRAERSHTSAPGTTALNLAWAGEACCPHTGTAEQEEEEEQQREAKEEKTRGD